MQRLFDHLICHIRAIEIAVIDVVHAGVERFAQNPDGLFGIALPTRSFAEAGMRRSGQLRHLELRVNFFWPRMKMGFVPNAK